VSNGASRQDSTLRTSQVSSQQAYKQVGSVAQWLERLSLTGELSCPTLYLQLTGDYLCG